CARDVYGGGIDYW
nr:immunoglobulin heavy chain junction region [Macaca mulatta]